MVKIGDYVIINDFDKPCTRLIAEVERFEGETVIARYVTTGTRMTHCSAHVSQVTPVWKFGVMFELKKGHITAAQISPSKATYRDGKPRNWQPQGEASRVRLRRVKTTARANTNA
jgi:sporulation protein YlmC with PRC-barrel domain